MMKIKMKRVFKIKIVIGMRISKRYQKNYTDNFQNKGKIQIMEVKANSIKMNKI
jgi:hypothetical protein